MEKTDRTFFERDPLACARELIGMTFRWKRSAGMIVETEAYAEHGDEACHTFFRPSTREFVAGHAPGTAYVYLNYGMYWLVNVLCKSPDTGNCGFVLLRALEPTTGIARMKERRGREKLTDLCSGPGKLSIALGIDGEDHGSDLSRKFSGRTADANSIQPDRRIGISRAQELEWRFLLGENPHVSVKFGKVK
ncbi:MAG: DNA-3-methyladenine glycosylase [Verrucomicrobiales bacterium]|nr:DNA-3-methyladenine glycosylase [Verrucomicrobiales bacterium]